MTVDHPLRPARPLAGRSALLLTDGKAGTDVLANGVADALGLDVSLKHMAPTGARRLFAPYVPIRRHERDMFAPPWPTIAIASGRVAIPYLRALRRAAGLATYTIILQDPKTGSRSADLLWVPQHDRLRGLNVVTTMTGPHAFTPQRLATLRATMPEDIGALPGPRVALILGGQNAVYKWTPGCYARLAASLKSMADLGVSFMITPSRRTQAALLETVEHATTTAPRILWDGAGRANPYPQFLAHADAFVVTADSVNMCGEAAATGKPVYVFTPSAGSAKFARFHAALAAHGATRPLPAHVDRLEAWTYQPLHAAETIAAEVERRWLQRQAILGPHVSDVA